MLKTEAIKKFLEENTVSHLSKLYTPEMEVQVNVAQDDGEPVDGVYKGRKWRAWSKDGEQWKSFRIPLKTGTYDDTPIRFSLDHSEGIGMTGWNFVKKQSEWVGYDFDSIANHDAGLTEQQLDEVRNVLFSLPYVTLIKSTSGKGYHMYVFLETPVHTENHDEHAAVARSILHYIAGQTGYDLVSAVDVCGMVLWAYHRKQLGTDGLTLVKSGDKFSALPGNWRDHISVTNKSRKKLKTPDEDLVAVLRRVDLDTEHKVLLNWFHTKAKKSFWWDNDNRMLVCHTLDLAIAHNELNCRGLFSTLSSGSSDQNCFCFPQSRGSWSVRRYTKGVAEGKTWMSDKGWTKCTFNEIPELSVSSKVYNGVENAKREIVFPKASDMLDTVRASGYEEEVNLPAQFSFRPAFLKEKDGRVVLSLARENTDPNIDNWTLSKSGQHWERVIYLPYRAKEVKAPDAVIRHAICEEREAGWFVLTNNSWVEQSKGNIVNVMLAMQEAKTEIDQALGKAILDPWMLVSLPFEDEYPGGRRWNRNCATFKVEPTEGDFYSWLAVFNHVGKNITPYVKENEWCQKNSIETGADYLLCWVASLFQKPNEPLPYLFLVGKQNSGKSFFHEALSKLFKRGYVRADGALTNEFNGEIEGAVLCIVEETDLSNSKVAANRIKDWVTGKTIALHTKNKTIRDVANVTHWIQCANHTHYCTIFPGDTRITMIRVDQPEHEIPKSEFEKMLEEEAPAFLYHILNIEIPEPNGRLAVPVIETAEKMDSASEKESPLERFIRDNVTFVSGYMIPFEEFYTRFSETLSEIEKATWAKNVVSMKFPKDDGALIGKHGAENKTFIGNVSWTPEEPKAKIVKTIKGRLEWSR